MYLKNEIKCALQWHGPRWSGRVTHVIGLLIETLGPKTSLGELCTIFGKNGRRIPCQVVGFKEKKVLLMALTDSLEISPGCEVFPELTMPQIPISEGLLGRVIDPFGNPLDGKGKIPREGFYPIYKSSPPLLQRKKIDVPFITGVRAIDSLCTVGKGQRMGIFSSAGIGKSTLLGMVAKHAKADVNVIGLIGERGREVEEFVRKHRHSLTRSVVIVATSDMPALLRSMGAFAATSIAEYFRDKGKDVLLMMDSISRFANARREIGLAVGEPPTTRGYTPSVFSLLPQLLERAGNNDKGTLTAFYTVLTEGEEADDPITLQMKSLVDGHLMLSRSLASHSCYPAIDILQSLSRLMKEIVSSDHQKNATELRKLLALAIEGEELISLGAYVKGANPKMDIAILKADQLRAFFCQDENTPTSFPETSIAMKNLLTYE